MSVLVSKCLLGEKCRYDGSDRDMGADWRAAVEVQHGEIVPVCPECDAGLPSPRKPYEIIAGDGADVLEGRARVTAKDGTDVTAEMIKGASLAFDAATASGAVVAVLASRSPSCGSGRIYDGTFSGQFRDGSGVAAAYLKRSGITVLTEEEVLSQ